ncbi:MAG: hypothetical protein ACPLZD_07080 [Candidatus Saccharicenans sp.]|nr:MAG: hypothetical protein C0168_08355 [Candidatus Aminicenantes bacterium]HEK85958.1 hypothetical protein [Candidatus Aminicenantes bacterium]
MKTSSERLWFSILLLAMIFYLFSCTPQARIPVAGSASGRDMLTLIPADSSAFLVLDWNRLMGLSLIQKTIEEQPDFNTYQKKFENFELNPKKDVFFLAPVVAGQIKDLPKDLALLVNLKYQKDKLIPPDSGKGSSLLNYQGIPYLPFVEIEGQPVICLAFLDQSNLAIGSEKAVKKIIDVYTKKIPNILEDKNSRPYLKDIDFKALNFGLFQFPQDWWAKEISKNPSLKPWENVTHISSFSDYRNGSYWLEIKIYARDKGQHQKIAEMLTGIKALGLGMAGQAPVLGEVLNSLEITSSDRYVKVSLSLKEETLLKIKNTLKEKAGDFFPKQEKEKTNPAIGKPEKKIS